MIPQDRCSQVNHEVRNSMMALLYYSKELARQAELRGLGEVPALDPGMEKTIARVEKALALCRGCWKG